jgi:[ribosomal protein S5]-alanine N-acetyltransferase
MERQDLQPFPILKTDRLILRQPEIHDDNEIFALRSNDKVNKYLDRKPSQLIEEARIFIRTINENIQKKESIYWAITLIEENQLIGTICLFDFSNNPPKAEIGFELLPELQGQGIMQEAINKVIEFCFQELRLDLIEAHTHFENKNSIRLLKKSGFKTKANPGENILKFIRTHTP